MVSDKVSFRIMLVVIAVLSITLVLISNADVKIVISETQSANITE